MRKKGLFFSERSVLLAGELAIAHAAAHYPNARTLLIGAPVMEEKAREKGLRLVGGEDADIVLVLRAPSLYLADLATPISAVRNGARLIAANSDRTHPLPGGSVALETGSIAELIASASNAAHIDYIGKPSPKLYQEALDLLNAPADKAVMIGNNPLTDGLGAESLGIRFLHVSPLSRPSCLERSENALR